MTKNAIDSKNPQETKRLLENEGAPEIVFM
jgi:hypothetical protein